MKTKLLYLTVVLGMTLGLASCDLDFSPSGELTSEALLQLDGGAQYMVDGCYALLKEEYAYVDPYPSGNTYVRHYFQMAEFPADNTSLSGRTTDNLYEATCYKMSPNLKNNSHLWWIAYKVIITANTVIENFPQGQSDKDDQLIGEAYFLRAMMHFNMVTLFATQYVLGPEKPGIVLRTSTNTEKTELATVGEVYDQVVADLWKASELMKKPRGNAGYASKTAALGLLSRVYLYEEKNDSVLYVINQMDDPVNNLDPDYEKYFANALSSKETIFASAHTVLDTRGQASIGSMYLNDDIGWGEVYASDPLLNLYERYPEDKRLSYIVPQYATSGKTVVYFSIPSANDDFRSNLTGELLSDADGYYTTVERIDSTVQANGKVKYDTVPVTLRVKDKLINGEYTEHYVTYNGEDCNARIVKAMIQRNTYPNYFVTKFSYQDDDPMLSSPVFIRWAEILLNRAEAYAKTGQDAKALADVNALRARAGISAAGMFSSNMHGYTSVLDIVLDERRMELAFEGHRMFDVYRNKRNMDRRFGGVQPWEVVEYTDPKIVYPIPYGETSVSGF